MECRVCHANTKQEFTHIVLKKYSVRYFRCPICELLQTEEPYWLPEAYSSSISPTDTGILRRNNQLARMTSALLFFLIGKNNKYLDYAGGYGIFTRLMRDYGFDYYWHDPYTQNLVARHFEYSPATGPIALISTFESFEHFVNPMEEIDKMLDISDTILFSTMLTGRKTPAPDDWWYYGFEQGQHVCFYSIKTLDYMAKQKKLYLCSNNINFHLLSKNKISQTFFNLFTISGYFGLDVFPRLFMKKRDITDMLLIRDQGKT
jgi:hypothetical protein